MSFLLTLWRNIKLFLRDELVSKSFVHIETCCKKNLRPQNFFQQVAFFAWMRLPFFSKSQFVIFLAQSAVNPHIAGCIYFLNGMRPKTAMNKFERWRMVSIYANVPELKFLKQFVVAGISRQNAFFPDSQEWFGFAIAIKCEKRDKNSWTKTWLEKIENFESNLLLFPREAVSILFLDHLEKHRMISNILDWIEMLCKHLETVAWTLEGLLGH